MNRDLIAGMLIGAGSATAVASLIALHNIKVRGKRADEFYKQMEEALDRAKQAIVDERFIDIVIDNKLN